MNKIPNRQEICNVLLEAAKTDKDIVVLCSDSRGSASLGAFAKAYPGQFVEVGIAEQDLVGIAAGLAKCGKKAYAASPACFLSTRSLEQAKIDAAYSDTNVKLIGISGGISYGALGMSHHSAQDIAGLSAIPNMRVYLPSDRFQTACLIRALLQDEKPAYIRVGRNAVEDIYEEGNVPFTLNKANVLGDTEKGKERGKEKEKGKAEVLLVACGEMVYPALQGAKRLQEQGIGAKVVDMYCLKPFDEETLVREAKEARLVVTVEEHSPYGGLGAMVSQTVARCCPKKTINLSLPDSPVVSGRSGEVFAYYGLDGEGISKRAKQALENMGKDDGR